MRKKFSLFEELDTNIKVIEDIDNCIKITLGPTGKNGIVCNEKNELKFITSGSLLIKSLEFKTNAGNVILKLLEQASIKTFNISGDGSTTTILIACQLLKSSLRFLVNGYNAIFLSRGLKKIAHFLVEKVLEFSIPISKTSQLTGILKTSLGKKLNSQLLDLLDTSISKIGRDGVILVEENISEQNELEIVQGIELDKGIDEEGLVLPSVYFEDGSIVDDYYDQTGTALQNIVDSDGNTVFNPFFYDGRLATIRNRTEKLHTYGDFLYWTVVTVSTIGYGDIYPSTEYPVAQAWGGFLGMYGLTFFALSISFVSNIAMEGVKIVRQENGKDD